MVVVDVRRPIFDEEIGQIVWSSAAIILADGEQLHVSGTNPEVAPTTMTVIDVVTGKVIAPADSAETWARNLPYAYRAGDLVAVVLVDTDPPDIAEHEVEELDITIPAPPCRTAARDELGTAQV